VIGRARRERPAYLDVEVGRGERVLAGASSPDGPVAGTRDALYLPGATRVPWHLLDGADWDLEAGVLTVREVGTFGQVRPVHRLALDEPRRLLELVRERVTATIVLTRHVPVAAEGGITVIARRPTSGDRELIWFVEYDAGFDPEEAAVETAVDQALLAAQAELGTG